MKSETILGGLGVRGPGPASRWAMEAIIRYVPWWLEAMFEEAEMWRKIAMQGEGNAGDAGRPASRVGSRHLRSCGRIGSTRFGSAGGRAS